jgi:nucleotide-binding universal stress UspA family protein
MFRTIIAGYDGSDEGRDALALAGFLAGESAERVVAAAVSEAATRIPPFGHAAGKDALINAAIEVAGRAPEEDLVDPAVLEPRGLSASSAAAGLHRLAEALDTDVVVVGSSHRGPLGRTLIGSTAARLLNGAPCPVAAAPRGFATSEHRVLRLIGLGYDGSHESRVALDGAARLAAEQAAAVRVFTVVPPSGPEGYDRPYEEVDEIQRAHHRATLDQALETLPRGIRPEARLLRGKVEEQLVEQTGSGLDLMVVGSRGYGPLRRVLLGSTANALMRSARCPVIVYPRGLEPDEGGLADTEAAPSEAQS